MEINLIYSYLNHFTSFCSDN